jgi:hypothetical protein
MAVVFKYGIADGDALVTDIGSGVVGRGRNQLPDYILTLVTKRTA